MLSSEGITYNIHYTKLIARNLPVNLMSAEGENVNSNGRFQYNRFPIEERFTTVSSSFSHITFDDDDDDDDDGDNLALKPTNFNPK